MARHARVRSASLLLAGILVAGGPAAPPATGAPIDAASSRPVASGTTSGAPARRATTGWAVPATPASVSLGPTGAGASAGGDPSVGGPLESAARSTPPTASTELPERRTETSRTIANPDGSFTLETYEERIHFRDAAGAWAPLDLRLVPQKDGAVGGLYDLAVAANDRSVRFATGDGSAALAELTVDGITVRARALGYGAGTQAADGNAVVFGAAEPGRPSVYARPTDRGFEVGATWADATAVPSVAFVLELGGATAELAPDGRRVLLRREPADDGAKAVEEVGSISAPVVIEGGTDEGAPVRDPGVVRTTLLGAGAELPADLAAALPAGLGATSYLLRYELDPAWLADPARAFPVVLDPTVCAGAGSGCSNDDTLDTFIIEGVPDEYPVGYTFLRLGKDTGNISDGGVDYENTRPLLYFDYLDLPDGAQVTSSSLYLRIGTKYGTPVGQTLYAKRVTRSWSGTSTWNDMTQPAGAWSDVNQASVAMPSGSDITFDTTALARAWYTRRAQDWRSYWGFVVRMGDETQADEITIKRASDGSPAYRPKFSLTYVVPSVGLDYATGLGALYSPSTLVAGVPTTIPVVVEDRSGSGATFEKCTGTSDTDCYRLGYRFLDAKGALVSSGTQDLDANIAIGASDTIGLSVTPPSVGQYTLRFDVVHRLGGASGTHLWASDWAEPGKFWSRNKKVLSPGSVRWVGTSVVERLEASVAVVAGGGGIGEVRTVTTGTGGTLGIDLATRNLLHREDTGLGFADLVPLGLRYGYNSADATGCAGYQGILGACGWYTNWDERLTPGAGAGDYTYQDPDGRRSLVATDGSGQLVSGAPVWLTRQRVTIVDENRPTQTPTGYVLASGAGVPSFSGPHVWRGATDTSAGVGAIEALDLGAYPYARFAIRTQSSDTTGLAFKIRNVTDDTIGTDGEKWFVYTIGGDWQISYEHKNVPGSPVGTWKYVSVDLLGDILANGTFGAFTDRYEVLAVQLQGKSGTNGWTYLDALRLEHLRSTWYTDTEPAWTAGGGSVNADASDPAQGASALRATPSTWNARATCLDDSGCRTAYEITNRPLLTWRWKAVGGAIPAMSFELKSVRTGASAWLTYYAGPTPPAGAPNPLRVADVAPAEWTTVTRNVREDARQVLGYYNETDGRVPVADRVSWVGWSPWAAGGGSALFDWMYVATVAEADPAIYNVPDDPADTAFVYDFSAIYPDRSVHYFNRDGLLERISDRDGNTLELDWAYAATGSGPAAYTLERIRGAADGAALASGTADRELVLTKGSVSGFTTFEFAEQLGSTTGDVSTRRATFHVATAPGTTYGIGDLVAVAPARSVDQACGAAPSGCLGYAYVDATSHRLAEARDPRFTAAAGPTQDYAHAVTWGTSANAAGDATVRPTAIANASTTPDAPLLRVLRWDNASAGTSYRRPLFQDAAGVAAGAVTYLELGPDGPARAGFEPFGPAACTGGDCVANLPADTGLANRRLWERAFEGLGRVSATTTYRCNANAAADAVCGGGEIAAVTRQETNAGAKVDNYADPLAAGALAWTQTADEQVASLRDSGGTNPDLYRTDTTANDAGQPVRTAGTATNQGADYRDVVLAGPPPEAYWRLDETSGTLMDSSPNNRPLTSAGSPSLGEATALVRDAGRAVKFDGTNDRATAALSIGQSAYSIEAWFRSDAPGQAGRGIAGDWNGSTPGGAMLYLAGGSGTLTVGHSGSSSNYLGSAIKPVAGRWYHAVATWNGGVLALYVNGSLVASRPMAAAPGTGASAFEIGTYANGGSTTWFGGAIDEVAVWNTALSAAEVRAHWNAGRAAADVRTAFAYDREGHVVAAAGTYLENGDFEGGLEGWRTTAGTPSVYTKPAPGSDASVHWDAASPVENYASLALDPGEGVRTIAALVPGQTVRVQWWHASSGPAAQATIEWWDPMTDAWSSTFGTASFADVGGTESAWTGRAWDLTLPVTSDGRLRVTFAAGSGSGVVRFDDGAILTGFTRTSYLANGLADRSEVLRPGAGTGAGAAPAFVATTYAYAATAAHPAIFPTTVVVNDVASPAAADEDVTTTTAYDAWGRVTRTVDPDGVASPLVEYSTGAGENQTDPDRSTDVFGEETTIAFDAVGRVERTETPLGRVTTTTYDLAGRPLAVTAPDGIVTRHVYNGQGQETATIANWVDGTPSGAGGLDDVKTTFAYDKLGRVSETRTDTGAAGLIDAKSSVTYDLAGTAVTATTYPGTGGTGTARTTTSYFETYQAGSVTYSRLAPSGTRLPIPATDPDAPVCPGTASTTCNAASIARTYAGIEFPGVDAAGLPLLATDAYGTTTRTWYDLAGRPVRVVANYVDGAWDPGSPDTDVATTTVYTPWGQERRTTSPLGRATESTFDALGRATAVRAFGSDGAEVSVAKAVLTPAGRTDRTSRADAPSLADSARSWTRTLYDPAGRAILTLDHWSTAGDAGLAIESFEGSPLADETRAGDDIAARWSSAAGVFVTGGASAAVDHAAATAAAGPSVMTVTPGGANSGVEWKLDGTFRAGRTYRATAWIKAPAGTTVRLRLGTAADASATVDVVGNGAWQRPANSLAWTPGGDRSGVVLAAYAASGTGTFLLDDAIAWDTGEPDRSVPTSRTVYDEDGLIVRTVLPPGVPGSDGPLVTTTAYDAAGRPTTVTLNAIAGAGSADATSNLATTATWDALGRATAVTDPAGITTRYVLDRLGRATATIQNDTAASAPASATADADVISTFAYDATGALTAYCPAAQVTLFPPESGTPCDPAATAGEAYERGWHWTYDAGGNRAAEIPPANVSATDLDVTTWTYDGGYRLVSVADAAAGGAVSRHTDVTFDALGRETDARTYQGAGTATEKLRTATAWDGDGARTSVTAYVDGSATPADTLTFTYDPAGRPDQTKRGTTVLTDYAWNADGTLASRIDGEAGAIGTTSFTYDWAKRLATATLPSAWGASAPATYTYRADGLAAARTWNGEADANALTFAYDAAKRPTGATKGTFLALGQGYDRRGNVTSESRTFAGITGLAGTGTQSFTYDALSRLTGSSGLAGVARTYGYDLDGNRVSFTLGSDSYAVTFDRTDAATGTRKNGGAVVSFAWDRWGNLLTDAAAGTTAGIVTYGYDLADRTTSITRAGTTTTLVLDALGRVRTRTTGTSVDTMTYEGASTTVLRVANAGGSGTTTDGITDAAGTRLGTRRGSSVAWLTPDLHGSIAAGLAPAATAVTDALRYDGYGVTLAVHPTGGSGATAHWRYQGRLDLVPGSPDPAVPSLYDFGFREYAPSLGAFTSLDDLMGSAQEPLSLNRFLYAAANPATLIDPDGHCATAICNKDGIGGDDRAPVRGPGAGTRAWLDAHARVVADQRTARTLARASASARTPAVRAALQRAANQATARAAEVARTAEVGADMAAYQPSAPEVLAMGATVLAGTLLGSAGAAALTGGAAALGGTAWATGSSLAADIWAGLVTAGPAGACAMGGCAALQAVGNAIESALTGGGTPSTVAARAAAGSASASKTLGWGPPRPDVSDPRLRVLVGQLYREGAVIGRGGTADAVRAGAGHIQKAADYARALERWLERHPGADSADVDAAQMMIQDLLSALAGDPFPGGR